MNTASKTSGTRMTAPYYQDDLVTLYHGDCIELLRTLPDASVDAVVTDPPYGLEFMGKEWDSFKSKVGRGVRVQAERADEFTAAGERHSTSAGPYLAARVDSIRVAGLPFQEWCAEWAAECLRVLKPGGHMLAFGGSRTWHRLAVAVEDAGFEIRDSIAWLYGSGFPKSMDVSKAIDKAAGVERARYERAAFGGTFSDDEGTTYGTAIDGTPITDVAKQWDGWGTALKPAFEPIVVARKPLTSTVAANVIEHGTGALNIDECRVGDDPRINQPMGPPEKSYGGYGATATATATATAGRWPTNVVLDESQAAALDEQSGILTSGLMKARTNREPRKGGTIYGADNRNVVSGDTYADSGGASRFFPTFRYEAKAPGHERPTVDGVQHPTVKPLDLMRWLVRLVTPPGGTVLEPFAGSGTTIEAALAEGFNIIGIERESDYLPLIMQRIRKPIQQALFPAYDEVRSSGWSGAEKAFDFGDGVA